MFLPRIKVKYLLATIILLGAFLRLYRIRQTLQFLGDQGRDAIIVRRMLLSRHPTLIGPVTSVGNMYLGPFYYYFMLLPLMITYPDPSGPAIAVALLGATTIAMIYILGKKMVGERASLIAAFFFAVSPLVINYSRFSWNPNILPFFAMLFLWHLYKAIIGSSRAWIWVALWCAVLVQLHYITLICIGFAGLSWLMVLARALKEKKLKRDFFFHTLIAIFIFLASLLPLVAFDVRHGYINSRAFTKFFEGGEGHFRLLSAIPNTMQASLSLFMRNITGLSTINFLGLGKLVAFLAAVFLMFIIAIDKKSINKVGERLLFVFFVFSCGVLALYRSTLYDHYLVFLYPATALLLGVLLSKISNYTFGKPLVVLFLGIVLITSLQKTPSKENLGYNIDMMRRTAQEISKHIEPGEKYNIFLFSPSNDFQGMNYRYFLHTVGYAPESENEFFNFPKLFVIDDLRDSSIEDSKHYQLVVWPSKKIVETFEIKGGPGVSVLKR